ncbi:uncharacterized, partial [Tachysurus ichikawai]
MERRLEFGAELGQKRANVEIRKSDRLEKGSSVLETCLRRLFHRVHLSAQIVLKEKVVTTIILLVNC